MSPTSTRRRFRAWREAEWQADAGEDTADNSGLRLSFMALRKAYQAKGKSVDDKDADGWTPRQKFLLAHAYSWCRN